MAEYDEQQAKEPEDVAAPLETDLQDPVDATEDQKVNDEGASVEADPVALSDEDSDGYHLVEPTEVGDKVAVRTSDSDDPNRAWTVQQTEEDDKTVDDGTPVAYRAPAAAPGQVFYPSQLPDVEVMKAAGIDPGQFLAGLPVYGEAEKADA